MAQGAKGQGSREKKSVPLPGAVDTLGHGHEDPSSIHMVVYGGTTILFTILGIYLLVVGSTLVGIAVIAIEVLYSVVLWAAARVMTESFFKALGVEALSDEEYAYIEAHPLSAETRQLRRRERLGGLLVPGDPDPMESFSGTLTQGERDRIEAARRTEALACEEWLDSLPDAGATELVYTTAPDNTRLCGHVLAPNPGSSRWVVLVHGFNGSWNEGMLYARHYAEQGYNLLMPEQRGHASSGGAYICMGSREGIDMVAWASWLVATYGEEIEIVLHGHSMGGASVCIAAGEPNLPSQVRAVVSDCAYSDAWNVFVPIIRDGMKLPVHPGLDMARIIMKRRPGGFDPGAVLVEQAVRDAHAPLLIIHGEADTFVPPYMAMRIYKSAGGAAAGQNRKLEMFPAAGHVQSSFADPARYFGVLFDFVGRYVGDGAPSSADACEEDA